MRNTLKWTSLLLTLLNFTTVNAQNLKMYVSDAGNFNLPPWQILKFDANGDNGEVFISNHLDWPQDILFLEKDNVVLISNLNSGEILRFNATSGAYINAFATGIDGPTRMKIGKDSLLYVLEWNGAGIVLRYKLDGTFVDQFSTTGVNTSIGLDWDKAGNLYVSSYNGKFVQKFNPSGSSLGKFISTNLAGPTNIRFDTNGDLLVNDYNAGSVKRFDSDGNFMNVFIPNVPQCEGVNITPEGHILMGVGGTSSVREYTSDGTLIKSIVPPGTLGLLTPNAVVLRQEGGTTSTVSIPAYKIVTIVTPSMGVLFHWSSDDEIPTGSRVELCNTSGIIVKKTNFEADSIFDASDLPDGIYVVSVILKNKSIARQKIIVQR